MITLKKAKGFEVCFNSRSGRYVMFYLGELIGETPSKNFALDMFKDMVCGA